MSLASRVIATTVAMAACSAQAHESGPEASLQPLVRTRGEFFVVVAAPETCAACAPVVGEWMDSIRRDSDHYAVALSRTPSSAELEGWALARVRIHGVVVGFEDLPTDVLVRAVFQDSALKRLDTLNITPIARGTGRSSSAP